MITHLFFHVSGAEQGQVQEFEGGVKPKPTHLILLWGGVTGLQGCPCSLKEAVSPVPLPPMLGVVDLYGLSNLHDVEVGEEGVLGVESEYV